MFHLNKIKKLETVGNRPVVLFCVCVGVLLKRVCIFIDHFKSGYGDLLFIFVEKEDEKGYLFPYGSFNWPIKNPYVSSSPILHRKHLRTKPNLTTNLNLFITKKVFFFSSFALIALKERYRYPPQIWGKRKEKKRSKRRRGALSSFACQLAFFFFFG